MDLPTLWAILLIIAAAVSLGFVIRRIIRGELGGLTAAGAVLFRLGLVAVGVLYATGAVARSRNLVLAAFAVAAAGAILHLAGGLAGRKRAAGDE
jgi:hypothetical protein